VVDGEDSEPSLAEQQGKRVKFLASVQSVAEAALAFDAGADIIDLKDPSRGALGALPLAVCAEIVHAAHGRYRISATCGDLPMEPGVLTEAVQARCGTGADDIKIAWFAAPTERTCAEALAPLARRHSLIAVAFADERSVPPDCALLKRCSFSGVMIDTAQKSGRTLLQHWTTAQLASFIAHARSNYLGVGLAGALRCEDIPALVQLAPDILGFRGALCEHSERRGTLSATRVQAVRAAMDQARARVLVAL
jgi:(5-formylfuran-3-yl)methyl phosphate synthase